MIHGLQITVPALPSVALPGASREPSAVSSVAEAAPHPCDGSKQTRSRTHVTMQRQTNNQLLSQLLSILAGPISTRLPQSKPKPRYPASIRLRQSTTTARSRLANRRYTPSWHFLRCCSCASDSRLRALRPSCLRCFSCSRHSDPEPIYEYTTTSLQLLSLAYA